MTPRSSHRPFPADVEIGGSLRMRDREVDDFEASRAWQDEREKSVSSLLRRPDSQLTESP